MPEDEYDPFEDPEWVKDRLLKDRVDMLKEIVRSADHKDGWINVHLTSGNRIVGRMTQWNTEYIMLRNVRYVNDAVVIPVSAIASVYEAEDRDIPRFKEKAKGSKKT